MNISDNFDAGSIEIVEAEKPENIHLRIKTDNCSDFRQWFYFRLTEAEGYPCRIHLDNASQATYPFWDDYRVVASYDRQNWFRVHTEYNGKELIIRHMPEQNSVYYALFAPYSYERHLDLIARAQMSEHCVAHTIGKTIENRDIDLLIIGEASDDKRKIWVVARQHPGETMAEWFVEGLINRLLNPYDAVSKKLLEKATFYIVPNINVDGSIHGNLRTNAAGANLNREWETPTLEKSPEVFHVRNYMDQTSVDLFLDVHGDEELPYNFVSACEGNPGYTRRIKELETVFSNEWQKINPDFQTQYGYAPDKPGEADMTIASNQVGQRFDCLSLTIEMPFKDNKNQIDSNQGWSPERSIKLGESVLNPILVSIDKINNEEAI